MKRVPYYVTVRQLTTGTDYSRVLYLKSPADAFDAMKRFMPHATRAWLRLISCPVATPDQITAHHARLAAI